MPNQVSKFEFHRAQLAASLTTLADSMRNAGSVAETFAKIVTDMDFSPEAADLLHGKRKAALSPEDDGAPKKRKRNTKPKDPNAPKRPASSYILFQNEVRKELKERNPLISNSDLLGMISEQWKNMSEEQKETYNQAMKTAKAQYSEEKKAYDNRTPEEVDAANAAAAAVTSIKKAKPRGAKAVPTPAPVAVQALPAAASPSTATSEDEDSEEEETRLPVKHIEPDSDSSDDEEEAEPEPAPKKRRGASAQPVVHKEKSKKASKA
ncbi:high mobility group box domain-containing protein [Crassisporium funariophilum]|nr:high mobility group box domain-containing protein [Crassisporium funariophilum]